MPEDVEQFLEPEQSAALGQRMSRAGTALAGVACTMLLISSAFVLSVQHELATLAASPVYASAFVTLLVAAALIYKSLRRRDRSSRERSTRMCKVAALVATVASLALLIWCATAINIGAVALTAIICAQGPVALTLASRYLGNS